MNSGMITPAARMKNAVIAPSAISMIQNSVEASRKASCLRPFCSRSVKTGTNAADSAALANRLATRFGTWKAIVNAEAGPLVPKKLAATISRTSPAIREKPVGDREDRGVARDACRSAGRRRGRRLLGGGFGAGGQGRYSTALRGAPGPFLRRPRLFMANIHSQKKRILRSERERLENRRYTSAIKTYFRRLRGARAERRRRRRPTPTHRELVTHDRQGRQARRAAPQHRRAQEVPRRAHCALGSSVAR